MGSEEDAPPTDAFADAYASVIEGIAGMAMEDLICSLQFLVQVVKFYVSLGGVARAFNS